MKHRIICVLVLLALGAAGEVIVKKYESGSVLVADLSSTADIAAETAARVAGDALKVNITDGVVTNLTVVSTNTLTHGATGIPVAKFVTLTNGLELWVWKASTTVWVRQTEWTED